MLLPDNLLTEDVLDQLASALDSRGYIVLKSKFSDELISALQAEARLLKARDVFKPAGTGRLEGHQVNARVRTDKIHWLTPGSGTANTYLQFSETLRCGLNQRLFLGLFDYESHYSCYEEGDFYRKHLDAFAGHKNRVLSTILYLNSDWCSADGGELILYEEDGETVVECIRPEANTFVIFLSERFPHEVKVSRRERLSLTGWFRINSSTPS